MLKSLTLTNFKSVRSDTTIFGPGLNILRGANEVGKSTRIHAFMYAMYGARALSLPLDDVVTWGQPVGSLKVEAELEVSGDSYRFTRSKGGAEVYVNGHHEPYVTGQTEVTLFATKLLGADMGTANRLMLSNQNNLRGALEQGAKATAEMIEGLADFTLFETLLDKISEKLVTGNDSAFKVQVEELKETLANSQVEPPNTGDIEQEIETLNEEAQNKTKFLEDVLLPKLTEARASVSAAKAEASKYAMASNVFREAMLEEKRAKDRVEKALEDSSSITYIQEDVEGLEEELASQARIENTSRIHKLFTAMEIPEDVWEGDLASLNKEIAEESSRLELLDTSLRSLLAEQKDLRLKMTVDTHCPTCKQPLCDHAALEASKVEMQKRLNDIQPQIEHTQASVKEKSEYLGVLNMLKTVDTRVCDFATSHHELVQVDMNFVPAKMTWIAATPVKTDTAELKHKIAMIKAELLKKSQLEAQVEVLRTAYKDARSRLLAAKTTLDSLDEPTSIDSLRERESELDHEAAATNLQIQDINSKISTLRNQISEMNREYERACTSRDSLAAQLKAAQDTLASLQFNNNLLKKIRAARPAVGDKLWMMILGAVSHMFTKMRGTDSMVTKGRDGFLVNGEAVGGLSGSTLDALGLAIRVALTRTFIPNCPFIMLDEPFAAADADRAATMLGFIQSMGFPQTILITHEDVSQDFADHFINLEN